MKIYTIAGTATEPGDQGMRGFEVSAIRQIGSYGSGGFPPCFSTEQMAEEWLKDNRMRCWGGTPHIVELELIGP